MFRFRCRVPQKNTIAILNYGNFECENYGAVLTAYALSKFLRLHGFNVKNIDYIPTFYKERVGVLTDFRAEYLPMTHRVSTMRDLRKLNDDFETFIVGSDQVFNQDFVRGENGIYYLKFVDRHARKIAAAASFGTNRFMGNKHEKRRVRKLLSRFDAISVREATGVDILRDMGLDGTCILDPVFLIDWDDVVSDYKPNGVFYYSIWPQVQKLAGDGNTFASGMKLQDWLAGIKNAELFVTDSFHGICFAIIFGTPFVPLAVLNDLRVERLYNIFDAVGIPRDKIISPDADIDWQHLEKYAIVPHINKRFSELRRFAQNWILNAIKG